MERISERWGSRLGTPGSAALIGFVLAGAGLLVANTACPRQRAWQTLLAVALGTPAILSLQTASRATPAANLPSPTNAAPHRSPRPSSPASQSTQPVLPHRAATAAAVALPADPAGAGPQVLNSVVGFDLFDFGRPSPLRWTGHRLALAILSVGSA
jgi:hypothetical protein